MLSLDHLTEEWFWVLAYCVSAPIVVIANLLAVCSIAKNSFLLRADAHRLFLLLALRNVARAAFALFVLFATRWSHTSMTKRKTDVNASTKIGHPVLCDILCTADTFLLALPLYVLVAMSVHFFTRYPSPQLEKTLQQQSKLGSSSSRRYYVSSLKQDDPHLLPSSSSCSSSSLWANILLPLLPLVMSALLALPKPLLHLTHMLRPVPPQPHSTSSEICTDTSHHLTYDVTVFMLGYLLPVVLVFFLGLGLAIRRCLHCSSKHCCNSWCKEEAVLAQLFVLVALVQLLTFVPTFEALSDKLDFDLQLGEDLFVTRPEVARAVETVLGGLALPLLLYTWMPTYRAFASEPDSDDVRLSKPKKVEMKKFEVASEAENRLFPKLERNRAGEIVVNH